MRSQPLLTLLNSVNKQALYPNEILIIDGSTDTKTESVLIKNSFNNLKYFKVDDVHRGLTKQRNFGISKANIASDIICFLDDDTVLDSKYFATLMATYVTYPEALAVGGYITNEVQWETAKEENLISKFYFDGWQRKEPSRFRMRKKFCLEPDTAPGFLPTFSHGRSIGFLPPSGKIYEVEQLMGGVSSYKASIFKTLSFSSYFEGYGLYEDADFSIRLAKTGKLYINTSAQLCHYHDGSGRPNQYNYGKMVIRNGWYVWRVKYPNPTLKSQFKWHATALLLTSVRFINVITSNKRKEALSESLGRVVGWLSLLLNKPQKKNKMNYTQILNLPHKVVLHFKTLGFQGGMLLFKRYIRKNNSFKILLPKYKAPIFLRNNTSDIGVFYQMFLSKSYNIGIDNSPKVIIDCGANIGLSTVFFKNKFPDAQIIAIEPEKSNFDMLKKNTKFYTNIHCLHNGIWNKSTNLSIEDDNLGHWGFTVTEVDFENENTISAISINDIMIEFNIKQIDILKIDIEGSEKELFEKDFENWLSITKVLIIELHDGLKKGASKSFFKAITKYDFRMIRKDENLIFYMN